jgi:hypothetical protein
MVGSGGGLREKTLWRKSDHCREPMQVPATSPEHGRKYFVQPYKRDLHEIQWYAGINTGSVVCRTDNSARPFQGDPSYFVLSEASFGGVLF